MLDVIFQKTFSKTSSIIPGLFLICQSKAVTIYTTLFQILLLLCFSEERKQQNSEERGVQLCHVILINNVETHAPKYIGPNSEGPSPKL